MMVRDRLATTPIWVRTTVEGPMGEAFHKKARFANPSGWPRMATPGTNRHASDYAYNP
jgi:hypothetical protein